jgi:hypothetical protein
MELKVNVVYKYAREAFQHSEPIDEYNNPLHKLANFFIIRLDEFNHLYPTRDAIKRLLREQFTYQQRTQLIADLRGMQIIIVSYRKYIDGRIVRSWSDQGLNPIELTRLLESCDV